MKWLYMKITRDNLELPLFVTESIQELAIHEGKTVNNIQSQISKYEKGKNKSSQYRRVLWMDK